MTGRVRPTPVFFAVGIVIILAVLSYTAESFRDTGFTSGDMAAVKIMAAKSMNPDLYATDFFLGKGSPFQSLNEFYMPFYLWIVKSLWRLTGDFETGLALLLPLVLGLFLTGMVVLLYRICGYVWIALGLALAATSIRATMGLEFWGVGTAHFLPALTLFTAIFPWLFLLVLCWLEQPTYRLAALTGLAIGLSANLHPSSAMNLTILAGVLFYFVRGFSWNTTRHQAVMAGASLLGTLPILLHLASSTSIPLPPETTFEAFSQVIRNYFQIPFRPEAVTLFDRFTVARPLLDYLALAYAGGSILLTLLFCVRPSFLKKYARSLWLVCGLVTIGYAALVARAGEMDLLLLAVAAAFIVYRALRTPADFYDWLSLGLATAVVFFSFASSYLLATAWETFQAWPMTSLIIEQPRMARFIYLPIYFLNARAAAAWINDLQKASWLPGKLPMLRRQTSTLALVAGLLFAASAEISQRLITTRPPVLASMKMSFIFVPVLWIATLAAMIFLIAVVQKVSWPGQTGIAIAVAALFFFTPAGHSLADYSPVPLSILSRVDTGKSTHQKKTQALYAWTKRYTEHDALFYWCGISDHESLFFRADTQRSLTHCRRDFTWAFYTKALFLDFDQHHRTLTQACEETSRAVSSARNLEADYILASSDWVAGDLPVCFKDERFTVYAVQGACPSD